MIHSGLDHLEVTLKIRIWWPKWEGIWCFDIRTLIHLILTYLAYYGRAT
jgi:hypothetical protein